MARAVIACICALALLAGSAAAAANETVTSRDPRIVYTGTWTDQDNGGHQFTASRGSSLSFKFQGNAIYYHSKQDPNDGVASFQVDSSPSVTRDASAGATKGVASQPAVLFAMTGLDGSSEHTLTVNYMGPGALGGPYFEIYFLEFTPGDSPGAGPAPDSGSSSTPAAGPASQAGPGAGATGAGTTSPSGPAATGTGSGSGANSGGASEPAATGAGASTGSNSTPAATGASAGSGSASVPSVTGTGTGTGAATGKSSGKYSGPAATGVGPNSGIISSPSPTVAGGSTGTGPVAVPSAKTSKTAIIGGAVGGALALLIIGILLCLLLRARRTAQPSSSPDSSVTPFLSHRSGTILSPTSTSTSPVMSSKGGFLASAHSPLRVPVSTNASFLTQPTDDDVMLPSPLSPGPPPRLPHVRAQLSIKVPAAPPDRSGAAGPAALAGYVVSQSTDDAFDARSVMSPPPEYQR